MARKTGLKGLQEWAKHVTLGYRDVEITNMTTSFRSGLAFCAIIHHYRPELIPYDELKKENTFDNNQLAFSVAESELDIPALLDAEDMVDLAVPDKLSIATYLVQYYNYFKDKSPAGGKSGVKGQAKVESAPSPKRTKLESAKAVSSPSFPLQSKENILPSQPSPPSTSQSKRPSPLPASKSSRPSPPPSSKSNQPSPPPSSKSNQPSLSPASQSIQTENSIRRGRKSKFSKPEATPNDEMRGTLKRGTMGKEECEVCGGRVFLMERLGVENRVFHRACFKCCTCGIGLKPSSYEHDSKSGKFYCQQHYREAQRQLTIKRTMAERGISPNEVDDTPIKPKRSKKFKTESSTPKVPSEAIEDPSKAANKSAGADQFVAVALTASKSPATLSENKKDLTQSAEVKAGLPSLLKSLAASKQQKEVHSTATVPSTSLTTTGKESNTPSLNGEKKDALVNTHSPRLLPSTGKQTVTVAASKGPAQSPAMPNKQTVTVAVGKGPAQSPAMPNKQTVTVGASKGPAQSPAMPNKQTVTVAVSKGPAQSPAVPNKQTVTVAASKGPAQSPAMPNKQTVTVAASKGPAQSPAMSNKQTVTVAVSKEQKGATQSPALPKKQGITVASIRPEAVNQEEGGTTASTNKHSTTITAVSGKLNPVMVSSRPQQSEGMKALANKAHSEMVEPTKSSRMSRDAKTSQLEQPMPKAVISNIPSKPPPPSTSIPSKPPPPSTSVPIKPPPPYASKSSDKSAQPVNSKSSGPVKNSQLNTPVMPESVSVKPVVSESLPIKPDAPVKPPRHKKTISPSSAANAETFVKRGSTKPKRPAPPRPSQSPSMRRESDQPHNRGGGIDLRVLAEKRRRRVGVLRRQLEDVEREQERMEQRGVTLEQQLRQKGDEAEDQLIEEWFNMVNEKNLLLRQESDLVYELKDLELIEQHEALDNEIRRRLTKDDSLKTEVERLEEEAMISELVELVEKRDKLLWTLHLEKTLDEEEDRQVELMASTQVHPPVQRIKSLSFM